MNNVCMTASGYTIGSQAKNDYTVVWRDPKETVIWRPYMKSEIWRTLLKSNCNYTGKIIDLAQVFVGS